MLCCQTHGAQSWMTFRGFCLTETKEGELWGISCLHTHSHTENNASYKFVWAVLEEWCKGRPLHHIKQRPTESQTRFDILICTPSRISLYPKLKCMCYDLISQTLAADNKTKWFHKSTACLLWAMTAWFLKSSVKNFAQQGFYQAIYLIYHPAPVKRSPQTTGQ